MKKLFTAVMAVVMLSSAAFAQLNSIRRATPQEAAKIAAMQAKQTLTKAPAAVAEGGVMKDVAAPATAAKTVINTFPYNEGFESGLTDWTTVDNDNDGYNWELSNSVFGSTYGRTGEGVVSGSYDMSTQSILTPDNWLISSQIQLPSTATDFELSWYDAAQDPSYPSENYSVYIPTTNTVAGITATTPVFTTVLTTNDWTKRTVSLASYAGQSIYVAFRHHNCTDMFYMKLDDLRIGGPEAPEITLAGPVNARMGQAYDFAVTATAGSTLTWSIEGTPTEVYNADSTVATLTWNTAGTYNVIATATNVVGSTSDTVTVAVMDCTQPLTIPFTAALSTDLGCWDTICDSTAGSGWFPTTELGLTEGSVASMSAQSFMGVFMIDFPVDNWLFSPEIDVDASGYEIAWKVKPYDPTYAGDHYGVYVICNGDTTLLFEETLNGNMTDYVQRVAALPASVTNQYAKIAFRHFNCSGGYVIVLDDIEVRSLSAPIVSVSGPASVIVNTPATYVANSSNADSYAWTVDGNDANNTTNTLNYTFTTGGSHEVVVAATNTIGTSYDTMNVDVIVWGDTMYYDNGVAVSSVGTGAGMYWAVKFDANALVGRTYLTDVQIYAAADGAGDYEISIHQGAEITAANMITTQTNTLTADDVDMWNTFSLYSPVTIDATQPLWIVLHSANIGYPASYSEFCGNYNASYASMDGIAWSHIQELASTLNCTWMVRAITGDQMPAPSVAVSGTTSTMTGQTATFTAVGPSDATYSWTLQGATPATATGTTVSATWDAAGTYTVTVTATNANGSASASMDVTVISCETITNFPYEMGFEAGEGAECWTYIDDDGDGYGWDINTWVNSDYTNTGSGVAGSASFINNLGALTPDNWMITPAIQLPAGNAKISWYVGGVDANYYNEYYEVLVSTTGNDIDNFTQVIFEGEVESVEFTEMEASLNQFAGQTIYIAFRHYNSSDIYWMLIDDIEITATGGNAIDEAAEAQVNIYPNPTNNRIVVEGEGIRQIEIIDVNGRTVKTQAQAGTVDMSELANGIYVVRTLTDNGVSMQKVIKK